MHEPISTRRPAGWRATALATALATLGTLAAAPPSAAQLAVSANDGHVELVDGVLKTVPAGKDSVSIIDLGKSPPVKLADVEVPASVVGPPSSVAVTPDERYAIVTASMKIDPADPTKQAPDNRVTVIELPRTNLASRIKSRIQQAVQKSAPEAPQAKVVQTIEAGLGAAGVSINRKGDLVLVANRAEGTVSVFTFKEGKLEAKGKVTVGTAASALGHVAITPDGKRALVTKDGDNVITVLNIEGERVELAKRDISAGLRPYGLSISGDGKLAVVANIGRGQGDADTVSLIDLTKEPPRVVDTISVGQTPEAVQISPDNKYVAVVIHNGSNKPRNSPFYGDSGRLVMLSISKEMRLARASEARMGAWGQGVAFSRNGRTVMVQNMADKELQVFSLSAGKLTDAGVRIKLGAGPAAIRVAEPPAK